MLTLHSRWKRNKEDNRYDDNSFVPMKLNNQRLPQKNTKSFTNGKPLCHYILATDYIFLSNLRRFRELDASNREKPQWMERNDIRCNRRSKVFCPL